MFSSEKSEHGDEVSAIITSRKLLDKDKDLPTEESQYDDNIRTQERIKEEPKQMEKVNDYTSGQVTVVSRKGKIIHQNNQPNLVVFQSKKPYESISKKLTSTSKRLKSGDKGEFNETENDNSSLADHALDSFSQKQNFTESAETTPMSIVRKSFEVRKQPVDKAAIYENLKRQAN